MHWFLWALISTYCCLVFLWNMFYTQLSLSLSASMSGVLALTSPARLSSHSLSGLSSGSGLRPRSPRLSWRLPGEKSLCLLARLAEPDTRVGVRHGLSTGILRPSAILDNHTVIGLKWMIYYAGKVLISNEVMRCVLTLSLSIGCSEQWGGVIVTHSCQVPQYFNGVVLFKIKIFCERHVFNKSRKDQQGTQTFSVVIKSFLYCWHN